MIGATDSNLTSRERWRSRPVEKVPGELLLVFDAQMLFDFPQITAKLGQFLQAHEGAFHVAFGRGGGAEDAFAGCDVFGDAGLGANHGPVADMDVADDSSLPGDDDVIA